MPDGPDLDEIEAYFAGILDGTITRDAADRWAGRWVVGDDDDFDELRWWALGLLYGIDLTHSPGEDYLHDDGQVQGWLDELRARRS